MTNRIVGTVDPKCQKQTNDLLIRFDALLKRYYDKQIFRQNGLPTVRYISRAALKSISDRRHQNISEDRTFDDIVAQLQLRRFRDAPGVLNWHFQSLERAVLKSKSTYSKVLKRRF